MNQNLKKVTNFRYLSLYFIVYSFIGWLLETSYSFVLLGHFTNRGFLFGPLCPIYGWGAVILISCLKKYKSNSIKLFFYSAIIFSLFEYIAGFALDALFAARWWDYTNDFMNLNGRISIFYSFAWGIIAILFINHIHPFMEKKVKKFFKKIPNLTLIILIQGAILLVAIDTFISCISYLNLI